VNGEAEVVMFCWSRHGCGGRKTGTHKRGHEDASAAMEILKERFARGEIDKAEFEEKRRLISEN
jgi:putative membrane protein